LGTFSMLYSVPRQDFGSAFLLFRDVHLENIGEVLPKFGPGTARAWRTYPICTSSGGIRILVEP
jgi:hypothetical protein